MSRWLKDNSLTLVLLAVFLISLVGQALTGWTSENHTREEHQVAPIILTSYIASGEFLSALFENWESEFLQMWAFVMLTAYLHQRGSPESKDPDETAPQDRDPAMDENKPGAPWPVRAGGLVRVVYSHSLGFALLTLFLMSFVLHLVNSTRKAADEAIAHGQAAPTIGAYIVDPEFWFESLQNWQSEFLSTAVLIVLAIYLRERGSPESKPVAEAHSTTG